MKRIMLMHRRRACILIAGALVLAACGTAAGQSAQLPGGDPQRGVTAIQTYGCGACHTIPGVAGANATVGPPLNDWADRHYIAGALPNTPENLIDWIRNPQTIEPGAAMPDIGVSEQDALDIGA